MDKSVAPFVPANFRISDDHLGEGGAKVKFQRNMEAIHLLHRLEAGQRMATPQEQSVLSRYVGWGGLADAFDPEKVAWAREYRELSAALTPQEYEAARASTLNAHYTSPVVIRAMYDAVAQMGFTGGNILEPSMGVGNFFGLLPESMQDSRLYGVELDSITGRIARQLYPKAHITVAGFETTDRRDFFDLAIGNVPFGNYKVNDRAYNKLGFSIHNYFFAKTLDQVRPRRRNRLCDFPLHDGSAVPRGAPIHRTARRTAGRDPAAEQRLSRQRGHRKSSRTSCFCKGGTAPSTSNRIGCMSGRMRTALR